MSSTQSTVYYCCVSKGNKMLYTYSGGDNDIEDLAALCLERTPPFHAWYFQTIRKKTFGYLMEDGYVYFTVVDQGFENAGVLQFLEHLRDEYKKVARNTKSGSMGTLLGLNPVSLEEQLVPVIRKLISTLEHMSKSEGNSLSHHPGTSPSPEGNSNCQTEVASSTKMPLLGKSKQEKKKMKDRVVETSGGSEDHHRATDRGVRIDIVTPESNNQGATTSALGVHKGPNSARIRTSQQYARKAWWRQVRLIIIIDAVICLVLFAIWLGICRGFQCVS